MANKTPYRIERCIGGGVELIDNSDEFVLGMFPSVKAARQWLREWQKCPITCMRSCCNR